ncbi:uncharacterized protein LOC110421405 [Herrania umbratica]|uniref:Uncharacterized protein LOC110421405 n=1 Tax=Herrania umbratica TaxID=108875 RepID=A0A6J1AU10_9ROSI|nr:uncharacterized protein LOC110421405 [Herrania umbratica]
MAAKEDQKDIKLPSDSIPEGWVLDTMVKDDGTQVQCYLCPPTDQRFYTYEDLMRYVRYAKQAKVSIYADNFWETTEEEDDFGPIKRGGKSSNPLEGIKIRDIKGKSVVTSD